MDQVQPTHLPRDAAIRYSAAAMSLILKIGKFLAVTLVVAFVGAGALFLSLRAYNQHVNAKAFELRGPKAINEAGYMRVGGIEQWVQIRGQDRDNPVLLCVHGGPGGTWLPVTRLFLGWEKEFTVVLWDQRGAGKTLKSTGASIAATMSVERMVQDGLELTQQLRARLGKEKLILLGHSFGSVLGVLMVKQRPDLFSAFVGTGQVSDLPRSLSRGYSRLTEQARASGDNETLRTLQMIGPPPYRNMKQVASFFDCSGRYQAPSDGTALDLLKKSLISPPPEYSLRDEVNRFRGFMVVPPWKLYDDLLNTNLMTFGTDFKVPVVIIQGAQDTVTPLGDAEKYFATLSAPHKEMTVVADGGHFAVWSHANAFLKELVARVRPLAL